MRGAFSAVMTFSSAAGTSTVQSYSSTPLFDRASPPPKPATEPVSALNAISALTSRPFGLATPPRVSETATTQ